jgi:hypothetical protein
MSRRWLSLVAIIIALTGVPVSYSAPPRLGMNLGGVVDWSSEWPFADAFKTSRPWMEQGPGPFTYDDQGSPLLKPDQRVETLIFRDLDGHYPAGDYLCTYDGTGSVAITQFDVEPISAQPGRIKFRVRRPGNGGILIQVTASSPRDPIRNLKVWLPGLENAASPFHPLYLERLAPFRVIRFMDWQRTNNSPVFTWSQRAKPTDVRWSTDLGVPIEVCVDLANALKADPWLCIPHRADDDFVRAMVSLVKERLAPDRKFYLEYSNEVWNWSFEQTRYAAERGKKLNLGAPDHLHFYARRSTEIFDIAAEVFGRRDRLIRVLSGQFANPSDCEYLLKYRDTFKNVDALAVGAYFGYEFGGPESAAATVKLTVDQLLDGCAAEINGPHRQQIRRLAALAKKYGVQLMAYEGGQHLVGHGGLENNRDLETLFVAANRHPRMADLYRQQLTHWFAEGGRDFIIFSYAGQPSKWGSWGVLEYQNQNVDAAPKYRAVVDFIQSAAMK